MNGDSLPDIVVTGGTTDFSMPSLSVLLQTAPAEFASPVEYWITGPDQYAALANASGIAIGDFDGDGRNDALVAAAFFANVPNDYPTLWLFNALNDPTITRPLPVRGPSVAESMVTFDYDGNGLDDLFVATGNLGPAPWIFTQRSEGSLEILGPLDIPRLGGGLSNEELVATGDVDSDGVSDMVMGDSSDSDPHYAVLYGPPRKPRFGLTANAPETADAGQDFSVVYRVENLARRTSLAAVFEADAPTNLSVPLAIAAGTTCSVDERHVACELPPIESNGFLEILVRANGLEGGTETVKARVRAGSDHQAVATKNVVVQILPGTDPPPPPPPPSDPPTGGGGSGGDDGGGSGGGGAGDPLLLLLIALTRSFRGRLFQEPGYGRSTL